MRDGKGTEHKEHNMTNKRILEGTIAWHTFLQSTLTKEISEGTIEVRGTGARWLGPHLADGGESLSTSVKEMERVRKNLGFEP